ncbi:hypothetical protein GCM10023220_51200 [Streptomyces ziwulingensis]|uniref:PPM-type phosphatase domain-containing protein n=1 Tax=Streptomyces ziwulingensis TaxID=1045501 RepID=A0ABP9CRU9_9ACTN
MSAVRTYGGRGSSAGLVAVCHPRLQRQAINTLGNALSPTGNDPDDPPVIAVVR